MHIIIDDWEITFTSIFEAIKEAMLELYMNKDEEYSANAGDWAGSILTDMNTHGQLPLNIPALDTSTFNFGNLFYFEPYRVNPKVDEEGKRLPYVITKPEAMNGDETIKIHFFGHVIRNEKDDIGDYYITYQPEDNLLEMVHLTNRNIDDVIHYFNFKYNKNIYYTKEILNNDDLGV